MFGMFFNILGLKQMKMAIFTTHVGFVWHLDIRQPHHANTSSLSLSSAATTNPAISKHCAILPSCGLKYINILI